MRPLLARLRKQMRQIPNLRYTARALPQILQRRLMRIRSRGNILTLLGVRRLASSFFICLRNLTFCASVVMGLQFSSIVTLSSWPAAAYKIADVVEYLGFSTNPVYASTCLLLA